MPTSTEIRKQLALDGADPFQIAADALARVAVLEARLAQQSQCITHMHAGGHRSPVLFTE